MTEIIKIKTCFGSRLQRSHSIKWGWCGGAETVMAQWAGKQQIWIAVLWISNYFPFIHSPEHLELRMVLFTFRFILPLVSLADTFQDTSQCAKKFIILSK